MSCDSKTPYVIIRSGKIIVWVFYTIGMLYTMYNISRNLSRYIEYPSVTTTTETRDKGTCICVLRMGVLKLTGLF